MDESHRSPLAKEASVEKNAVPPACEVHETQDCYVQAQVRFGHRGANGTCRKHILPSGYIADNVRPSLGDYIEYAVEAALSPVARRGGTEPIQRISR